MFSTLFYVDLQAVAAADGAAFHARRPARRVAAHAAAAAEPGAAGQDREAGHTEVIALTASCTLGKFSWIPTAKGVTLKYVGFLTYKTLDVHPLDMRRRLASLCI